MARGGADTRRKKAASFIKSETLCARSRTPSCADYRMHCDVMNYDALDATSKLECRRLWLRAFDVP